MTTRMRLFPAARFGGVMLVATLAWSADLQPALVSNLNGTLRVQQDIPCGENIDVTTPVTGGTLELTPAEGIPASGGNRRWTLTGGSLRFAGFSVTRSCLGFEGTRSYGAINVQISRAVSFTGTATPTPHLYSVVIPKADFQLTYVATLARGIETGTKIPTQDVTGSINLATGIVRMHVVLGNRPRLRAGCVVGAPCAIDETPAGTFTADIIGTMIFPDTDRDGVPDRSDNCKFTANPAQETIGPVLTPPPDVTLTSCLDRAIGRAFAADRCDGGAVSSTNDAPALFKIGPNLVTWTARDAMGRTATATQTVTIVDITPPTVSCTPTHPTGSSFRVSAHDVCTQAPVLRLGNVVLGDGETIMINETGKPGIRLVNDVSARGIRHFQVGRGQAIISATDASNNVASVACSVPR